MEYVWNTYAICMEYVCNMYGICMQYVCNMYGICMEYVWNMYGICVECVGGVGHVGCPVRCSQDSHPPRTYRVHSAYSRPQKGDEGPAWAWPAAIWATNHKWL